MMGILLLGTLAATPRVEPAKPKQGDLVVIHLREPKAETVRAWFHGEELPVSVGPAGWQTLVGIDLAAPAGPRAVTGITVKGADVKKWKASFRVYPAGYPVQHLTLADESKVVLSDADGARAVSESTQIRTVFRRRSPREWSGPFIHPLDAAPAGGRFGSVRIINNEPRNAHTGADYGAKLGDPVHASNSGKVVLAAEHFFAGNSIFLDHGDGLYTMYFHLSKILVTEGQEVKKGDIIGQVGATGRASGPHLHFGINYRGARINPATALKLKLE
jgi:murein DD-endopeptidase MepM/ murein hydrolase activator NlpD